MYVTQQLFWEGTKFKLVRWPLICYKKNICSYIYLLLFLLLLLLLLLLLCCSYCQIKKEKFSRARQIRCLQGRREGGRYELEQVKELYCSCYGHYRFWLADWRTIFPSLLYVGTSTGSQVHFQMQWRPIPTARRRQEPQKVRVHWGSGGVTDT